MNAVGVDPGIGGGISALTTEGSVLLAVKMPETDRDLLDLLMDIASKGPCFAMLEFVASMPGQGVSSVFKFGEGYGKLQMALCAAGIPFARVTPAKWQGALGCRTGGNKNISKGRAQELFPSVKCTHAISDSLLLAEYCRRTRNSLSTEHPPQPQPA